MNIILKWFITKISDAIGGVFSLVANISSDTFTNEVVKTLLSVFKGIGLSLVGLAILMLGVKGMLDHSDGKGFSIVNAIKRCAIGVIVQQFGVAIMKNFYLVFLNFTSNVVTSLGKVDIKYDFSDIGISTSSVLSLILIIIALYYMMKTFLNLIERFWQYLVTLCMLYMYVPGYIMGNDEALIIWFKQTLAISLTQLFQITLVVLGMTIYASAGDFSSFSIGIGAIMLASKVEQLLDKYGQSAGGSMGTAATKGMSFMYYAKNLMKAR